MPRWRNGRRARFRCVCREACRFPDFLVLNPEATPLLARKTRQARSLDELLFALIVLGDDRVVEQTVIGQQGANQRAT